MLGKLLASTALAVVSLNAGLVTAIVPTETELVAVGGEVIVYFAGQTAGFDSQLNLIAPSTFGPFFQNHSTPVGTSLSLGIFAPGDILRFRLDVTSTGLSYFTGPAAGNPDGLVHVGHGTWVSDGVIPVNGILVGFEDIFGGGDLDYDDNTFVFSNVRSTSSTPEPATWALMLAGIGTLGFLRRRAR